MRNSLILLAPTLSLSAFAFALFGVDTLKGGGPRKSAFWLTLVGLAVTAVLVYHAGLGSPVSYGRGMLVADGLSFFLTGIALATVFFVVLLTEQDQAFEGFSLAAYYGLLLLAAVGLILVASANDFLMIFLSIELVGVPGFILTGYLRHSEKSGEAAVKFFLIGAFSSAMLAYGISILYGLSGSTSLASLQCGALLAPAKAPLALVAVFFILVSFGFKIALVPFHMWVPDAFEGAPVPIAAFLSVAPKVAGVAIALRVFNLTLPSVHLGAVNVLALLAALTMTVANLIGLQQTNVVRLLAYSSIAHMGYLLLGLIAGGAMGISSVYFYGGAYLFMNLGAFAVVICLGNALRSSELAAFAGLARRAPLLSALFVLFLFSLAGIPPTVGFVAKFYVFWAAFSTGWIWLVVLAAVNSVISIGYYFKILRVMYFEKPVSEAPIPMTLAMRLTLAVTSFVTLFSGIFPETGFAKAERLAPRPAVEQPAASPPVTLPPATLPGTLVQP
jgi:NADH-quinone oxidoreductase subunit N